MKITVALLVLLHGCRGDSPPTEPRTGPLAAGDHDRTLVVGGLTRRYILHVPPLARALVGEVGRRVPIDPTRVYATGLSNGAMMAYRLAADAPDLVAAIAPVAGAGAVRPRPGSRAVPTIRAHSTRAASVHPFHSRVIA